MKKEKKNIVKWLAVMGSILLFAAVVFVVWRMIPSEDTSVLKELQNINGYIRTVGTAEYEFFAKLVERDTAEELSDEDLEERTKAKINRVNAEFMLANQIGLCHPYSFESFQRDMENENSQRKLKKEKMKYFMDRKSSI